MIAPHKGECPIAVGQVADQSTENAPIIAQAEKAFKTLQAQFSLRGHALHRASSASHQEAFYAERWGQVRYLPTLDDARRFLAQIGGRHE